MLIDEVEKVVFKAGHGGFGAATFNPGKKGGPSGGNGGKGGDLCIKGTSDLTALNQFSKSKTVVAENGEKGSAQRMFGRDGKDLEISLPIGSELVDLISQEVIEIKSAKERVLLCKGGIGGRGNFELKSARNTTPEYAQGGLDGESREFRIVLKYIADYGLIGLPNAGKSSLLNELTGAKMKVGDYPFTTTEAGLGSLGIKIIADIPGLIADASKNKGLGIRFLKHIEKVGLLLHCIAANSPDPLADYRVIRKELEAYSAAFKGKKEVILLTKSDLLSSGELKAKLAQLKSLKKKVYPVSIHDWDSLEKLKKLLES